MRTVLTGAVGIVTTIAAVPFVIAIASVNDTSPWIERIIHWWSRAWLRAAGSPLEIQGSENIDPNQSYVVVANHLSTLDIMACFLAVPLPIRFLAKKELFRIPLLAQGMRAAGIVEVDREARGAIHATVNRQAEELVAKGRSIIIYAEGTRPRNGAMKPFKKGAFTMAIAGQLPILPVSIHGTYEAFPPGQPIVRGGPIGVVVHPPLQTAGMSRADTTALRDQTREIIANGVRAMGGEVAA